MQATSVPTASSARSGQDSPTPARLAADLGAFIGFLMRASGPRFLALVEERELSLTQLKTLQILDGCERELSVKELAEQLALSLPATSRNVEGLLQRGYLERQEDEHDRRIKRLRISDAGRELAERLYSERVAGLEELAATLTDRQRRQLGQLLSTLQSHQVGACRSVEPDSGARP